MSFSRQMCTHSPKRYTFKPDSSPVVFVALSGARGVMGSVKARESENLWPSHHPLLASLYREGKRDDWGQVSLQTNSCRIFLACTGIGQSAIVYLFCRQTHRNFVRLLNYDTNAIDYTFLWFIRWQTTWDVDRTIAQNGLNIKTNLHQNLKIWKSPN